MQRICRTARQRTDVLSARSLLALAVSDALAACRQAVNGPRRRDAQPALALATAVVFAVASSPARAETFIWRGIASTDWFYVFNWHGNRVPVDGADVVISNGPFLPVIDGRDVLINTIRVGENGAGALTISSGGTMSSSLGTIGGGGEGVVTVTGAGSSWINSDNLLVGDANNGTLLVEAGGTVGNQHAFIGNQADSVGKATVTGAGSTWTNAGALYVGISGTGTLEVLDGGVVTSLQGVVSNGGDATVLVDGAGSQWNAGESLVIGNFGAGQVTLGNGGVATSTYGIVGNQGDAQSTMRVQDAGSAWTGLDDLYVGFAGNGALAIEAGGRVESAYARVGSEMGSTGLVTVTGAGSSWTNSGNLGIGNEGTGALLIGDGATMDNTGLAGIADQAESVGGVTVTGAGSRWTISESLAVAFLGTGTLSVLDGGEVNSRGGSIDIGGSIGVAPGSHGQVLVAGEDSNWTTDSNLRVGEEGSGTLRIEDGGAVSNTGSYIGWSTDSVGEVTVTGSGSTWANERLLALGASGTGTLLVEAGGAVVSEEGYIGFEAGSIGEATVTGAGSSWAANGGWLIVGSLSTGTLEILDGGVVSSAAGMVGRIGDGTVLVDGEGSRWDAGDLLTVGFLGAGQMTLSNGGVATSMQGVIGSRDQARNTVLVQGAGSSWTGLEDLYVGLEGNAALTVADGGRVEVRAGSLGTDVVLGEYGGSSGTLNIGAGGAAGLLDTATITGGAGTAILNFNHDQADYAFTNDGTTVGTAVLIGGSTTVNQIGTGTTVLTGASTYTGETNVNAGTLLVEGSLGDTVTTVADGGMLGGSGSIAGDVTIADGGGLAPGSSAGTLTVGSLSLSSGATLDYELGQAGVIGSGVNDLIEVNGDLTLDGTLDVTDIGGFGAGVYRLINYGGDLTDNGLEFGTRPTGVEDSDLLLQTTFDGQVNLVSAAGLTLTFWDGEVDAAHNNDAIDGGAGTWTGNDRSWTQADGAVNGHWDNGEFAVFGGRTGNVQVVDEQAVAGMQFMSGYTLASGTDGALRIDRADSVVRVDPDVTATIAAPITGAGGLVKIDTGTLVLSGDNSYEGGTRIDRGTLRVGSDANLGDVAGALAFDGGTLQTTAAFDSTRGVDLQADGGTFLSDTNLGLSGAITGAGALTKDGAGTLTLAGANSYIGGTRVLEGTLVGDAGSIRGNLANDGNVVFDQADDGTFAGAIAGAGTLAKRGAGALMLTGNSGGFTGTTSLASGTLQLDGALGGNTLISNGAVLTGSGRLGSVDNHGTLAPGHSIGRLTLTGDYIHHDDATLLAGIAPGGDSDLLDIAGKATIEGGTVEVLKAPGQYAGGTRYIVIEAAGGVSGTFGTLGQDLPFLDLLLGYDTNHVYLDIQRNDVGFNIVCGNGTFNQCQVAGALDRIAGGEITDDLQVTLAEVTSLDLPNAQAAFNRLSGEAHGNLAGLLLEGHAMYGQAVSRRIAERRDETCADRLHGGAWIGAYGNSSDLDGDGNAHAADFEQRGLAVGFDAWGDEHWLIGASFNATSLDADFRPGDHGEADTRGASLYATFEGARAYLDVVTSFSWWDNEITRGILVGDIDRHARSTYGGHRFATHLEGGWNFALGERQQLTPLVSVEYSKLDQEGFREDGAQDLDLIGRSQEVERTTATAGLRWSTAFGRGAWTLEPTVQARWLHAFGDGHAEQEVALAGAPAIGYRVRGVSWPQDRGLLGVGLQIRHGDNLDLFVDVDYQKGGGLEANNLGAGVRWRW